MRNGEGKCFRFPRNAVWCAHTIAEICVMFNWPSRHSEVYLYTISICLLGQNVTARAHLIMHRKIFEIILLHLQYTLSYCPKFATVCIKPMIYMHILICHVDKKVANYDHLFICYTVHSQCHREFMNTVTKNWPLYDYECNIMHYNKICSVCCVVQYLMLWSQKLGFIIKHAFKHSWCSLFMITHALQVHYAGTVM